MKYSGDSFARLMSQISHFVENDLIQSENQLLNASWSEISGILEEKRRKIKDLGFWLPQIDQVYGGLGLSLWQFGQISEILGRSPYGHYCFNCQAPDAGNMELLIEFGSQEQIDRFLRPLLAGRIRSCFAMTEPQYAGSNPLHMGTVAHRDGNDYIINGHKWFTSGADGAAFVIVMALTDPDHQDPYQRASQIIVPMPSDGVHLVRNVSVMGDEGGGWASHGELKFTDLRVPQSMRIGAEGAGFSMAQSRLGPGRIHHCMRWLGICERAFDLMCKRAVERQWAPGVPLASKQSIQHWIAESRAQIDASKLMVERAAKKMDAEGQYAARIEISTVKWWCAEVLQKVLDRAIQVHGALGMSDDLPLAYWYRHERAAQIYDGADEVHKSRVAKQILKQYRS